MSVRELILQLQKLPPDAEVFVERLCVYDDGHSFEYVPPTIVYSDYDVIIAPNYPDGVQ